MGKFVDVSSQVSLEISGIIIRDSGTKLFVVGNTDNTLYRYTLSTAWDISTASYDTGQSLSLGSATWADLHINSAGTKVYVMQANNDRVLQWTLNTAWDLTDFTYNGLYSVATENTAPIGLTFSADGTKMYVFGSVGDNIYQYSLTTAHDITGTVTYDSKSLSTGAQQINTQALFYEEVNDHFYTTDFSDVDRYTLSTTKDISTGAFDTGQTFTFTEAASANKGMCLSSDGTHLYSAGQTDGNVYQYDLSTAYDVTTAAFDPPITADGAVTITPTIAGTGDQHHAYADSALTISPTLEVTATNNTNHSDGAVTITPTISGTASPDLHAAGAVVVTPTITATGTLPPVGYGAVTTLTTVASTASIEARLTGDVTLPSMTAEGYIEYVLVTLPSLTATGVMTQALPSNVTLPALQASATAVAGTATTADVTLPLLQAQGYTGNTASLVLPSLTAAGTMVATNIISAEVILPALIAYADVGNDRTATAAVTLPAMTMNGFVAAAGIALGDMTLPRLKVFGVNAPGTASTGDVSLPAFNMDTLISAMISQGLITSDLTLPSLQANAYIEVIATLTHSGWAFNTESMRTSEYDNYNYLMLENIHGRNIGVASDGIYELTGDTDNAVNIDADVLFGLDKFRTEDRKRVKSLHIGYRADNAGDLNVQIVVDGEAKIREYIVKHVSSVDGIKRGRATPGKGLKSRYWQYGVKNVAGADFSIDDLNIFVQQHNRKA